MTVCEPSSVGFNMADLEVMTQLPKVCEPLLKALAATPYRTELENAIQKKITAQRSATTFTATNNDASVWSINPSVNQLTNQSDFIIAPFQFKVLYKQWKSGSLDEWIRFDKR